MCDPKGESASTTLAATANASSNAIREERQANTTVVPVRRPSRGVMGAVVWRVCPTSQDSAVLGSSQARALGGRSHREVLRHHIELDSTSITVTT
jgi:hypothetical protein